MKKQVGDRYMRRWGTTGTEVRYSHGTSSTTVIRGRDCTCCSPSATEDSTRLGRVLWECHGQARPLQPRVRRRGCALPPTHRIRRTPTSGRLRDGRGSPCEITGRPRLGAPDSEHSRETMDTVAWRRVGGGGAPCEITCRRWTGGPDTEQSRETMQNIYHMQSHVQSNTRRRCRQRSAAIL